VTEEEEEMKSLDWKTSESEENEAVYDEGGVEETLDGHLGRADEKEMKSDVMKKREIC
jgi:hypothetical protein